MLLTEYDEEKTLKAEYYAGERAGLERGHEEGLKEGLEQATEKYVINMYANHLPPEQIATLLNLDLDKVINILSRQGLLKS